MGLKLKPQRITGHIPKCVLDSLSSNQSLFQGRLWAGLSGGLLHICGLQKLLTLWHWLQPLLSKKKQQ